MPHQCTGCGHTFEDGSKEMLSGCPGCGGNTFQFRPDGADLESPDAPDGETPPPADDVPADVPDEVAEDLPGDVDVPTAESGSVAETVGRATTKVRDFVSSTPDATPDSSASPDPDAAWPDESRSTPTDPSVSGGDGGADDAPAGGSDDDIIDADARRKRREAREDAAQSSARSDVVSDDELGLTATGGDATPAVGTDPTDARTAEAAGAAPIDGPDVPSDVPPDDPSDVDVPSDDAPAAPHDDPAPSVDGDGEVVSAPSDEDPDLAELREQLNDQFESIKIVEPGQYELNLMELYDREEYIIALQENGRYVIQVPEQWMGEEPGER